MLHPQALVVGGDRAAGDCLELRVAPLHMRNQLQHVLHLIALSLSVRQALCSSSMQCEGSAVRPPHPMYTLPERLLIASLNCVASTSHRHGIAEGTF